MIFKFLLFLNFDFLVVAMAKRSEPTTWLAQAGYTSKGLPYFNDFRVENVDSTE